MKRAAVIGLGTISEYHLSALAENPNIELAAVCDCDESVRDKAPERVPFYTDYVDMIEKEKPDCVHLCLPHHLHVPVAEKAVEMGCHVFSEKPVALHAEQAQEFARFEQAHPERKICICLQNRLNDTVETLKSIIESGEYGRVTGTYGIAPWSRTREYYEEKPWRAKWETAGGGCMVNQAVHTLDLLYYLGGPIRSLKGSVSQLLDYGIEVEDTVSVRLDYENGAAGMLMATNANFKNMSVQLVVQLEKAEFELADDKLYRIDGGRKELLAENERLPGAKFYFGVSHKKLINKFYEQLETDGDDYIHVKDAQMCIRLIDAIHQSSREKRTVEI